MKDRAEAPKRWTAWDASLFIALLLALALLLFPFLVQGVNYCRVARGMSWDAANAVFSHRLYDRGFTRHDGQEYRSFTLSGPPYIVLKLAGRLFGQRWDLACAVLVRYERGTVVAKAFEPFCRS